MSFDARMKELAKSFASKSQVDNALNMAETNREKIKKNQTFGLSYFDGRSYFNDDK